MSLFTPLYDQIVDLKAENERLRLLWKAEGRVAGDLTMENERLKAELDRYAGWAPDQFLRYQEEHKKLQYEYRAAEERLKAEIVQTERMYEDLRAELKAAKERLAESEAKLNSGECELFDGNADCVCSSCLMHAAIAKANLFEERLEKAEGLLRKIDGMYEPYISRLLEDRIHAYFAEQSLESPRKHEVQEQPDERSTQDESR